MKTAPLAALVSLVLLSACGKVGNPLPPIIRIPVKVEDLSATQIGDKVILGWTNPAQYVDGNPASDLGTVHIFQNLVPVGMVAAGPAGQRQSFAVDVTNNVGRSLTFTIQMGVPRNGATLPVSNSVPIRPVDVPGPPRNLQATVDQGKIVLTWQRPAQNTALAEAYQVQRSDRRGAERVTTPKFEDSDYEAGKPYSYTVTAMSGATPGGSETHSLVARDTEPPATPTGLSVQPGGPPAIIRWNDNTESDLRGYRLYRSDRTEPIYTGRSNGHPDPDYVPAMGLSYRIQAEDNFGNFSPISDPQPGP